MSIVLRPFAGGSWWSADEMYGSYIKYSARLLREMISPVPKPRPNPILNKAMRIISPKLTLPKQR